MSIFKVKKWDPTKVGFLIVDVQESLVRESKGSARILVNLQKAIQGLRLFNIPCFVTEQYPRGLGNTVESLKKTLGPDQKYFSKTSFSCLEDPLIKENLLKSSCDHWVIAGLETHICVLQTAKDLHEEGKEVLILHDCTSSRSLDDFVLAIAEMRHYGMRVSSTESILFELLKDAKAPQFKQISQLIKNEGHCD